MWGDGEQTRSFMYIDDCVEGILRIMMSGFDKPLNLGTEEMVSMNQFAEIAMSFEEKALPIRHIPGPQGVRGRNSDNTLIREKIGWEPSIPVREGLREVRCLVFFFALLAWLGCWVVGLAAGVRDGLHWLTRVVSFPHTRTPHGRRTSGSRSRSRRSAPPASTTTTPPRRCVRA